MYNIYPLDSPERITHNTETEVSVTCMKHSCRGSDSEGKKKKKKPTTVAIPTNAQRINNTHLINIQLKNVEPFALYVSMIQINREVHVGLFEIQ